MNRLWDGGYIDGPASILADGGTIEVPFQADVYGRHFNGGTIELPHQVTPVDYPDLDDLLVGRSFVVRHDNTPTVPSGSGEAYRTPIFEQPKYQNGSVARVLCESIWKNKTNQRATFTATLSTNPATPIVYERRNDHSAVGIDLSCVSPWNSEGGRQQCGTLINPTHTIHANHAGYFLNNGATIRFVSMDNVVHERTVVANQRIDISDLHVCRLNSPLPEEIQPAVIPPAEFWRRFEYKVHKPEWTTNNTSDTWCPLYPIFRMNQQREVGIRIFAALPTLPEQVGLHHVFQTAPFFGGLLPTDLDPVGGDSGCPVFWPWHGRLLLIFPMWFGAGSLPWIAWSGSPPCDFLPEIEDFAGAVEVADMSTFEDYYA